MINANEACGVEEIPLAVLKYDGFYYAIMVDEFRAEKSHKYMPANITIKGVIVKQSKEPMDENNEKGQINA